MIFSSDDLFSPKSLENSISDIDFSSKDSFEMSIQKNEIIETPLLYYFTDKKGETKSIDKQVFQECLDNIQKIKNKNMNLLDENDIENITLLIDSFLKKIQKEEKIYKMIKQKIFETLELDKVQNNKKEITLFRYLSLIIQNGEIPEVPELNLSQFLFYPQRYAKIRDDENNKKDSIILFENNNSLILDNRKSKHAYVYCDVKDRNIIDKIKNSNVFSKLMSTPDKVTILEKVDGTVSNYKFFVKNIDIKSILNNTEQTNNNGAYIAFFIILIIIAIIIVIIYLQQNRKKEIYKNIHKENQ